MKWQKAIHQILGVGIPLLFLAACVQVFLVTNNYIRLWRMPIWRLRNESSFTRSANYIMSKEGAEFLNFLNTTIPPSSKVVPANHSGAFSQQSILQFFMLDKTIIPCSGKDMISCLSKPDKYIIATNYFPPDESDIQKKFIQFPNLNPEYPFKGVYVPLQYSTASYHAVYPEEIDIFKTFLIDCGILFAWFLLGWLIITSIIKSSYRIITLIAAFPMGMGIFTWSLFWVCLAGAPLTLVTIVLTYIVLLLIFLVLASRHITIPKKPKIDPDNNRFSIKKILPTIPMMVMLAFLLAALLYIGVGRGYSTYDDMAIWSLKGYYMAFRHNLFSANSASGHGLSYPLNLPLTIASFFLIDFDVLPGSKLAFFVLFLSMLSCITWYLRDNGLPYTSILVTLLVITGTPIIFTYASYGFANIPFTCYLIIGSLAGLYSVRHNDRRLLLLSALLLSLSGWTRPEGIGYVVIMACIIGLFGLSCKMKGTVIWLYFATSLMICGSWLVYGYQFIRNDEIGGVLTTLLGAIQTGSFRWDSILVTFSYTVKKFTTLADWGVVLPVAFLLGLFTLPSIFKSRNRTALSLLASSLFCFAIPFGMFVVKFQSETNYLGFLAVSFDRAQFPAVVLFLVYLSSVIGSRRKAFSATPTIPINRP